MGKLGRPARGLLERHVEAVNENEGLAAFALGHAVFQCRVKRVGRLWLDAQQDDVTGRIFVDFESEDRRAFEFARLVFLRDTHFARAQFERSPFVSISQIGPRFVWFGVATDGEHAGAQRDGRNQSQNDRDAEPPTARQQKVGQQQDESQTAGNPGQQVPRHGTQRAGFCQVHPCAICAVENLDDLVVFLLGLGDLVGFVVVLGHFIVVRHLVVRHLVVRHVRGRRFFGGDAWRGRFRRLRRRSRFRRLRWRESRFRTSGRLGGHSRRSREGLGASRRPSRRLGWRLGRLAVGANQHRRRDRHGLLRRRSRLDGARFLRAGDIFRRRDIGGFVGHVM